MLYPADELVEDQKKDGIVSGDILLAFTAVSAT